MTYYINPHISQFDGSAKQGSNCTPAAGSNAAIAVTGGTFKHTAGWWRGLVKPSEETNPLTPGWSLQDLDLAMTRVHIGFDIKGGTGWDALVNWRAQGHYIVLQGDSDQFGNSTCSGAFDGLHCIGVHPHTQNNLWRIDDPICKAGRYESPAVIKAYAQKLHYSILYGITSGKVPQVIWGAEVPLAVRTPDPVGNRVRAAITLAGHNPGALVNLSDVSRALDRIGHDWGSVINAGDVQWLLDWASHH